ncbi:hypothetical protein Q5752_005722 [Cryptotrichosporon argae]
MTIKTKTLAITGLNGFVATHVAVHFLERGWAVRGSVRGAARVDEVKAHAVFGPWVAKGKLDVVVVDDIVNGDYTALFKDVAAIVHLATPLPAASTSYASIYRPTIDAAANVIAQAARMPSIGAVSIISTASAVIDLEAAFGDPEAAAKKAYGEDSWFPLSDEQLEALDPAAPFTPYLWYGGAKKAMELAAAEAHKNVGATSALSLVCPPMVYGPALTLELADQEPKSLSERLQYGLIAGKDADLPQDMSTVYTDARDLSEVFFQLVTQRKSGRWLVAHPEPMDWTVVTDTLRKVRPQYAHAFPVGKGPGLLERFGSATYDSSKSVRELGITYRSLEQTFGDAIDHFAKIGKLQARAE